MRMGDEYLSGGELADFGAYAGGGAGGAPTRWGSAHGGPTWGRGTPQHHLANRYHTTSCYEAEDANYGIVESTPRAGSLRGRSGLYYSPPGTSYTIVERPSSTMGVHHHREREYQYTGKSGSSGSVPRGTYLGNSTARAAANKKRPISPEQVLKLFGNGTAGKPAAGGGGGSGGGAGSGGGGAGGTGTRRSPASSPASTTHQAAYVPRSSYPPISLHELSTRTVTMMRDPPDGTHGFGICVKGGKDAGVGVYISRVEEGSVAERAGLRPGDSILEVNGTPFTAISHDEALKMLKSCRKLSMTVRSPTIPGFSGVGGPGGVAGAGFVLRQTCSWMDRQGRPVSPPMEYQRARPPRPLQPAPGAPGTGAVRRVDLCIEPGQSLGLMIRGGVEYNLGIFITGVDKESVADRAGLLIGDQILEVNGQSFLDVTHDEAVNQLKFHKRMSLLVRDVGKVPHSCTAYDHRPDPAAPWSPSYDPVLQPGSSRTRSRSAALQMVEEKARTVLPKSDFPTLCYYTDEYTSRRMTVDAFVAVMIELLNTPEKYTLLTELREVIYPEDRVRFDELVYRREGDPRSRDLHRDYDIRHTSRRKPGMSLSENNHTMLMSSLHDMAGPDYSCELGCCESDPEYRSPSEDSGLGLAVSDRTSRRSRRPASATPGCTAWYGSAAPPTTSGGSTAAAVAATNAPANANTGTNATDRPAITNTSDLDGDTTHAQEYGCCVEDGGDAAGGRRSRRHSSPGDSRSGSATALHQASDYEDADQELAHKLSRSFDMKDDQSLLDAAGGAGGSDGAGGSMRRHQSMQRLSRGEGCSDAAGGDGAGAGAATVVPDHQGNLRITVKKSKPILGIAIEGGANTKHPLPRIINIHENGAAYDAGGLEVGQLILEVDGTRVDGLQHQEVARLIAESFARRDRQEIEFYVVEAKKSNLEPKPTALIFLEA